MRTLVTGAGGFVGRQILPRLAKRGHEVIATDLDCSGLERLGAARIVPGSIADPEIQAAALAGAEAVLHLATVPGGTAEQDPALARSVNVDAAMALSLAFARQRPGARFVFASSVAALGDALADGVDERTEPHPRMYYGAHKAMIEVWLATLSRRKELSAFSLRLPGIVARPEAPSGMKSAFVSNVFHTLLRGEDMALPVSRTARMWLLSVAKAADALVRTVEPDFHISVSSRAVTLPALSIVMGELVDEICCQTNADPSLISHVVDPHVESVFGGFPIQTAGDGDALGFKHDQTLKNLVATAISSIMENVN